MKYFKKKEMYVLVKNNQYKEDSVCAITTDQDFIMTYINQFNVFNSEDFRVLTISDKQNIKNIAFMYSDKFELMEFIDGIILTQAEIDFYNKTLKEMYDDTKRSICQILILNNIMALSITEKDTLIKSFDMLYGKFQSYQDFVSNIDKKYLIDKILMEPNIAFMMMDHENSMLDRFHYNIDKD